MMTDHDDIEADRGGGGARHMGGGAAIHGYDQRYALRPELSKRRGIGAVSLLHAVGDVELERPSGCLEKTMKQRRGSGSIDIIIPKGGDTLSHLDGACEPQRGAVHVTEPRRIRENHP